MTTIKKIKAEIDEQTEIHSDGEFYIKNIDVKRILAKYAEQEPCDDIVSRQEALNAVTFSEVRWQAIERIKQLPSVRPQETVTEFADRCRECGARYGKLLKARTGHCKDCKYFEYDSVAKVDGVPLIVAHEICNKWGDGCKTREDGYCFLFEPQESEDKE